MTEQYLQTDGMWEMFARRIMSKDHFWAISKRLHISDPETDAQNDARKGKTDYDKLAKIRPLMEWMSSAF